MRLLPLLLGLVPIVAADKAATSTESSNSTESQTEHLIYLHGSTATVNPNAEAPVPTGDYLTYSTTRILNGTDIPTPGPAGNASSTSVTSAKVTQLVGKPPTGNETATATSTGAPVVNTQPCNGHPEFCSRSYSNITMVAAHNSPFVRAGNAAANQALGVQSQLDDGIRMLEFQAHMANGTLYLCHTTCDLLNVGTLESYLSTVSDWMKQHPYDVVTILMGNFDRLAPSKYIEPFEQAGLMDLLYTPSQIPMALNDWPTLSTMILSGKRVVVFLDYGANQTEVPWLMDEFSQMWETPFSPTDPQFPCTEQRPPGLSPKDAEERLYLANHNLNVEVSLGSFSLLIPNTARLNQTNGVKGPGSLGAMARECTQKWDRPPNFLLVDYYNYGTPNGTVFEVAALMNNVTYNYQCCGKTSAASRVTAGLNVLGVVLAAVGIHLLMRAL